MSGIGAHSFVEGLQGGIQARDRMDRNKQFKQMRKLGIDEATTERSGRRGMEMENQMQQLGDDFSQEDFDAEWGAFQQDKDPALLRFGKWMGGKMSGMFGGGKGEEGNPEKELGIAAPKVEAPTAQVRPGFGPMADGGIMSRQAYANGGEVEEESDLMKRQRAQAAESTRKLNERDLNDPGIGGRMFNDAIAGQREASAGVQAGYDAFGEAEGAAQTSDALRQIASGYAGSVAETGMGLAKDVLLDNPLVQGVGGFLFGSGDDAQAATQGVPTSDVPSSPEGDAIGASVDNPATPPEDVAQAAIGEAEKENIENFDYKLLVDQGVRPEDLPSMSTTDWAGYRQRMTLQAAKSGMNPVEAHQMVDQRITQTQMTGFQREGQKAMLYLQTGQNREAAMALRQAYQYFPNGTTVKFGTMTDPKTGQPAIMTMGFDEETGEPSGSPMLITTERLTTMMENMSNPDAFRSWTKDGRDLQLEINKLQSSDDYRQGSLEIAGYNAETDRLDALTGGGSGGASRSSNLADAKWFTNEMKEKGLMEQEFEENPRMLEALTGAMIRLTMAGEHQGIALEEVMQAYSNGGGTEAVQQLLQSRLGQ